MTHRLAILFTLVRQHVQNQQPPAGLQCARGFRESAFGFREMVQDEQEQGDIQFSRINRQLFQRSLTKVHMRLARQPLPRRPQHFPRGIHHDNPIAERRQPLAHLPCTASQITNHLLRIQQPRQRPQMARRPEKLFPQAIPLARWGGEKRLGLGLAALEDLLQPAVVIGSCRGGRELLADHLPELLRWGIDVGQGEGVEPPGSVPPRADPVPVE